MSTAGNGSPGMRMGRPFGIPVYVSPTWLIVAGLITVVVQPQVADGLPGHSEPVTYAVALIFAVLLYLSVLLHELAHCVVAKRYGLPVRRITLYMLGGVSEIEREPETAGREFAIAFAGPLVSLGLAGVGYALSEFVLPPYGVLSVLVWELWTSNLIVGVFNLLPGLPLDGGRILRAAVWKVAGSSVTGTTVAAWVGRALAVAVISIPLLFYLMAGQPPSIWGLVWTLILASFIWMGASQALRVARVRARLPQLR